MLLCCRLFMILAATGLIAAAIALATDEPGRDSKVEVATIEPGTAGLTAVELEKLADASDATAAANDAIAAANDASTPLPLPKKASEISTIVVRAAGIERPGASQAGGVGARRAGATSSSSDSYLRPSECDARGFA